MQRAVLVCVLLLAVLVSVLLVVVQHAGGAVGAGPTSGGDAVAVAGDTGGAGAVAAAVSAGHALWCSKACFEIQF